MNRVRVLTDRELSNSEINKIRSILLQSQCPNESLKASIKNCVGYINGEIHIYEDKEKSSAVIIEY